MSQEAQTTSPERNRQALKELFISGAWAEKIKDIRQKRDSDSDTEKALGRYEVQLGDLARDFALEYTRAHPEILHLDEPGRVILKERLGYHTTSKGYVIASPISLEEAQVKGVPLSQSFSMRDTQTGHIDETSRKTIALTDLYPIWVGDEFLELA